MDEENQQIKELIEENKQLRALLLKLVTSGSGTADFFAAINQAKELLGIAPEN